MEGNDKVSVKDLVSPVVLDNTLSSAQKDMVSFDIYLNGQRGTQPLGYDHLIEFLDMYGLDPSSKEALMLESGMLFAVPEGNVRLVRISPNETNMKEFLTKSDGRYSVVVAVTKP